MADLNLHEPEAMSISRPPAESGKRYQRRRFRITHALMDRARATLQPGDGGVAKNDTCRLNANGWLA
jgi:hypothetical protein